MTFKPKYKSKTGLPIKQVSDFLKPKTNRLLAYALPAFATFLVASSAIAGTDTSFGGALAQISLYLQGSLGQLLAVASLIAGLVAMVIFGFRLSQVAVPVIIGVGAATGIPIVTSAITATI
ncbi:MAG: hypothetical protein L3J50_03475 [Emcibacter sp.]|nr:hypothetical protein [Emcibacter sp.]